MEDKRVAEGVYAYDIGQVPSQPVLITNADKGKVADLKPALKELVMDSPGNRAVRVSEDSQCIGVQYIELDSDGGKEYTMPAERIATTPTEIEVEDESLPPHQYAMYLALRDLFAEAAHADEALLLDIVSLANDGGVPEQVVSMAHDDVAVPEK